jgi:methylated-DNA-[protein]-cysteine S-methyltransferase
MARNRYPLVVPCHRVLASGGIGGYSAPDGLQMKRRLLAMESST